MTIGQDFQDKTIMDMDENSTSLKVHAYRYIKNKIITCEYLPESPISEKELMKELQVSRTPIREALSSLASERLVQIYPKRGIFVTSISEKDILDIYTIRETIEPVAARFAAYYIEANSLSRFADIFSQHQHSFSPEEHLKLDREFHMLIAHSCDNEYLKQILTNMYDHNSRIRHRMFKFQNNTPRMEEAIQEHIQLIRHLTDRNPAAAEEVMARHIANGKKAAMRILNPILT